MFKCRLAQRPATVCVCVCVCVRARARALLQLCVCVCLLCPPPSMSAPLFPLVYVSILLPVLVGSPWSLRHGCFSFCQMGYFFRAHELGQEKAWERFVACNATLARQLFRKLPVSLSLSLSHTHTHTHTHSLSLSVSLCLSLSLVCVCVRAVSTLSLSHLHIHPHSLPKTNTRGQPSSWNKHARRRRRSCAGGTKIKRLRRSKRARCSFPLPGSASRFHYYGI